MNEFTRHLPSLALAVGLALAPSAAADVVIGSAGETFSIVSGTYGALRPEGHEAAGENPVLMLDVKSPGESPQRLLVPGTDGWQWEEAPALVYEDASKTVYIVWISWDSSIHPMMNLIGFGPNGWSERIELVGNPFAAKSPPAVAVTRDSFRSVDAAGAATEVVRTLVHLVWGQEGESGWDAMYAPVLFVDGTYTGQTPLLRLDSVVPAPADPAAAAAPRLTVPVVRPGRDAATVVIGFDSPADARFRTVEVRLVAADLVRLAGEARAHIIDTGARAETPDELRSIADEARAHIIDTGVTFDPHIVRSLADGARAHIIDTGVTVRSDDDLRRLASEARAHIIDTGVSMSQGLRRIASGEMATSARVAIPTADGAEAEHLLVLNALSARPTPPVPADGVEVFLSKRGNDAILAWSDAAGSKVFYLESEGGTWTSPRVLELGPGLSAAEAFAGLDSRISGR